MKIIVWGLGYVGTVSAACLSSLGHKVLGVDVNRKKVDLINIGQSPIQEPDLEDLIKKGLDSKRLKASSQGVSVLNTYHLSLICVGTPSKSNGDIDLSFLEKVCSEIAIGLRKSNKFHTIVLRSTVFPGVSKYLYEIIENKSGKVFGKDFGFVMNPEFLREATAINDFYNPPYTVIGGEDERSLSNVMSLYSQINSEVYKVSIEEAEILKLANNAFHATKITFANEVGRICEKHNINGSKVMEMVVADKQLNISEVYLKPGFAFGGSCLPKDLRSIIFNSEKSKVSTPLLNSLLISNKEQINLAKSKVHNLNEKSIGILGLSFKQGTDDIRESPVIELISVLSEDGFFINVFDKNIQVSNMLGENLSFLLNQIPDIKTLLVDNINSIIDSKVILITYIEDDFLEFVLDLDSSHTLIDLAGIPIHHKRKLNCQYLSLFN